MSKKIITTDSKEGIWCANPFDKKEFVPVPEIKQLRPIGCQVLVEFLTSQELANTKIVLEKSKVDVPLQGYVRAVGPKFKSEDWTFDIGDRVLISGGGVPVPNLNDSERLTFVMEPTAIKCVLVEA